MIFALPFSYTAYENKYGYRNVSELVHVGAIWSDYNDDEIRIIQLFGNSDNWDDMPFVECVYVSRPNDFGGHTMTDGSTYWGDIFISDMFNPDIRMKFVRHE